jgi:hypothetical protein
MAIRPDLLVNPSVILSSRSLSRFFLHGANRKGERFRKSYMGVSQVTFPPDVLGYDQLSKWQEVGQEIKILRVYLRNEEAI